MKGGEPSFPPTDISTNNAMSNKDQMADVPEVEMTLDTHAICDTPDSEENKQANSVRNETLCPAEQIVKVQAPVQIERPLSMIGLI